MQELAAERISLDSEDDEAREIVCKDAIYLLTLNKEMTYEYISEESQFEDLELVSEVFEDLYRKYKDPKLIELIKARYDELTKRAKKSVDDSKRYAEEYDE